ncbi:hypothetical protein ACFOZ1_05285 [Gracilibacillus marinus]|jgi:ABC-2 type transport system permease protein|uniref:ABC-2 type transport system permease protein n=1 Tax=Gracilibacillus marinus TaxID=630535 RepID=A0ABV8VW12_9BACI
MQLKMSYFKKEIIKQHFRTTGWIGIAYFVILLFILPLDIFMKYSDRFQNNYFDDYTFSLLEIQGPIQSILMITVPVLAGMFSFRYANVKGSADFMHSLPIKRTQLFNIHFIIGYVLIVLPVLLTGLIMYLMTLFLDLQSIFYYESFGEWFAFLLIIPSLIYTSTVMVGGITGITAVQGGLTYIFLFFPSGIVFLIIYNLYMLLYGFSISSYLESQLLSLSPLLQSIDMMYTAINSTYLIVYVCISVAFYFIGLWLFKIRNVESASHTIIFTHLKPIFKIGVTICFMLLFGLYFGAVQNEALGWISFGYVFGACIGYILAEMLIQKTWRIFGQWKGFLIYLGIAFSVIFVIVFDLFRYETNVPEISKVESVEIEDRQISEQYKFNDEVNIVMDDPQLIEQTITLHKQILQEVDKSTEENWDEGTTVIKITYNLKSGLQMSREYFIPSKEQFMSVLKPIYESDQFKKMNKPWLFVDFNKLKINEVNLSNRDVTTSLDMTSTKKLIELIQLDYLDTSFVRTESTYYTGYSLVMVLDNEEHVYFDIPYSYTRTLDYLLENGYAFQFNEENVGMVAIKHVNNEIYEDEIPYLQNNQLDSIYRTKNKEEIKDLTKLIEMIDYDGQYEIIFYGNEDNVLSTMLISEENLPTSIINQLK